MSNQICKKGLWDSSIPGIEFDDKGVSNFCKLQEHMIAEYPRGEKGKEDWEAIVHNIKKVGSGKKYDCVVGVSGGVDSSYLLYLLKEYGLNPLAVNLDNGFNSQIAVQNIYKVTKLLNIDLETYVVDYEEVKALIRSYMKASLPWIDTPTDLAIKALMYKVAIQENIKFILRGNDFRSEGKQPLEWTYADTKQLNAIYNKFEGKPRLKTYPQLSLLKMLYAGIFLKIKDVRPFYYLDYSKQNAKEFLKDQFDWKDYGGHHHENLFTKFSIAYWLPMKFGIDKRKISLSAQVVSKQISREEGLQQLQQPFASENELLDLKEFVLKKLDLSIGDFDEIWNTPNRKVTDYPSNYNLIYKHSLKLKVIISKLFSYTPMSVTAHNYLDKKK